MRLGPLEIKSESDFYQHLLTLTQSEIFYERVEPSNESGFPDAYFLFRDGGGEGTLELKYFKPNEKPELDTAKLRGNQKAALIEYHQAGGRRRFVMAFHSGSVYVWDTSNAVLALMRKSHGLRVFGLGIEDDEVEGPKFAEWLREVLV